MMAESLVMMALIIAALALIMAVAVAEWALRRARHAEQRALAAEDTAQNLIRLENARRAARSRGQQELANIRSVLGVKPR